MKVLVYDTYVPKDNSTTIHFDILVAQGTSEEKVYKYGKQYLESKAVKHTDLTTKECKFCHIETAPENVQKEIQDKGYYIIEMENC